MATQPNSSQRQTILSLIAHHPDGVLVTDISVALGMPNQEETVTRWLDGLIDESLVIPEKRAGVPWYVAVNPEMLTKALADLAPAQPAVAATVSAPMAASPVISAASETAPAAGTAAAPSKVSIETGVDPDFPAMFDLAVPVIVGSRMKREGTLAALRTQAMKNDKAGRAMGAYVRYAIDRIDNLIATDVADYGFSADEFLAWQRKYRDQPRAASKPGLVAPDGQPNDEPEGESEDESESARLERRARRANSESESTAKPSPPAGDPTPHPAPAAVPDLGTLLTGGPDLVQLVKTVRGGSLLEHGKELARSLLTWRRIALVVAWGITLRLAFLRELFPPPMTVLALIPVAGIPWLAFRLSDRLREERGISPGEAAFVLLIGGWISLWAARQLIGFVLSMRYSLG